MLIRKTGLTLVNLNILLNFAHISEGRKPTKKNSIKNGCCYEKGLIFAIIEQFSNDC